MKATDLVCGKCGVCEDCESVMPDSFDLYVSTVARIVREETICRVEGATTWRRFDLTSADDRASLRNFFDRRVTPVEMRRALSDAHSRGYVDPDLLYRAACGTLWKRVRCDGRDPRGPKPDYYADKRRTTGITSGWTGWTAEEERRLLRYLDLGLDLESIALLHGRSERAIATRIARLGAVSDFAGNHMDEHPFDER